MSRFTVDGSAELDALIDSHLAGIRERVLAEVGSANVAALVLGGGYGRGEGGVRRITDGERPYNDYDLVLFHQHPDAKALQRILDQIHHDESRRCGLHVDVTPIHRDRIPHLPSALTWYELGAGHVLVAGDPAVLEPLRQRTLAGVHQSEWGRLLVNRATGVAMAQRRINGLPVRTGADEDTLAFAHRQVMKAWLALGDVALADAGLYHPQVQHRRRALPPVIPPWWLRWQAATAFKFAPTPPPERRDLVQDLAVLRPLLATALAQRPASMPRPLAGLVATLRMLPPSCWWPPGRYPREHLRRALVAELSDDPKGRDRAIGSWEHLERVWERYG